MVIGPSATLLQQDLPRLLAAWRAGAGADRGDDLLKELGFRAPAEVQRWVSLARAESPSRGLHGPEQDHFEALLPVVVATAAQSREPEVTLRGALDVFVGMARWPRYLAQLAVDLGAAARLTALVGASPWVAELLIARPALADELLPGRYAERPPARAALAASLADTLRRAAEDEAAQQITLRNFKHSCLLHILALDLEGTLPLDEVSGALTDLADVLLEAVLAQVSRRHGYGPTPPIGIVAYGKLGSREMSYASDADVVFLHDDVAAEERPALTRLASEVNQWITVPTAAGRLYATDFRLRPYGDSGLLLTGLGAFRDYQVNAAWTWEHQALTRARWIAGGPALAAGFSALRREILGRAREPAELRRDVLAMRARIAAHQPGEEGVFDVKHSRGGLIDVEFIAQYLVLRHAHQQPELLDTADGSATLARAAALGLVNAERARGAAAAYAAYRGWMHRERLRGNEIVKVESASAEPHQAVVRALWSEVFPEEPHSPSLRRE